MKDCSILTFVRTNDNLFVGMVDSEFPELMINPRTLGCGEKEGSVILQVLVGEPKEIRIHDMIYSYANQDATFLEFYNKYIEETLAPPEEPKSKIVSIVKH